jgi:hypothetical protein
MSIAKDMEIVYVCNAISAIICLKINANYPVLTARALTLPMAVVYLATLALL